MDATQIADRIGRGLGVAARRIGLPHDLYRPAGPLRPLGPEQRVIRLHAAFNAESPGFTRPAGWGKVGRFGVFDTAYTRVGDYLYGPSGTFFIAAQDGLSPPLLVVCNRTLDLARTQPTQPRPGALAAGYAGGLQEQRLLEGWPASVIAAGGSGNGGPQTELRRPGWTVLLPVLPVALRSGDRMTDDFGRTLIVQSAEQTTLGWRLAVSEPVL
jgi:hypothetical protein